MASITEIESKKKELPSFNPGEIIEVDGWPRWRTHVGPFELLLDIVSVGRIKPETEKEMGIASFVVMEQEQLFLDFLGNLLAKSIISHTSSENILLITAESKGSHFAPWVWHNLAKEIGGKLEDRMITLRKGEPKVYMQRPVRRNGQEMILPKIPFYSITSSNEQNLIISPKDAELLFEAIARGAKPILVDDFIGRGGTTVATCQLFQQLGLESPHLMVVVGSDGKLYEETFAQEGAKITLLPQPLPLRLPTFIREDSEASWQINT